MSRNVRRVQLFRVLFWTHFMAAVLVPFYTDWAALDLSHVMVLNAWFMAWNFLLEIPTGAPLLYAVGADGRVSGKRYL